MSSVLCPLLSGSLLPSNPWEVVMVMSPLNHFVGVGDTVLSGCFLFFLGVFLLAFLVDTDPLVFPWWLSGEDFACSAEDVGLIPGMGRSSGEGNGNPLQYSCLKKISWTEQPGELYSPWGRKELDMT